MITEIQVLLLGLIGGIGASVVAILGLIIGFCVLFGLSKLRTTGRRSMVIKSLDELVGERVRYLPPDAPRGPIDQLGASAKP
jgi:hypothetical protein